MAARSVPNEHTQLQLHDLSRVVCLSVLSQTDTDCIATGASVDLSILASSLAWWF
jgi:hypothetical protein